MLRSQKRNIIYLKTSINNPLHNEIFGSDASMILNLVVQLCPVVEEKVPHHSQHLVRCLLLTGQRLQPVTELLNSLTCNGRNDSHWSRSVNTVLWLVEIVMLLRPALFCHKDTAQVVVIWSSVANAGNKKHWWRSCLQECCYEKLWFSICNIYSGSNIYDIWYNYIILNIF